MPRPSKAAVNSVSCLCGDEHHAGMRSRVHRHLRVIYLGDECLLTPRCLVTMLDVLLSLVVVGIPERTASEGRGVEVEGAGGSDEECRAQDVDERVEAGQASLDTVEGLLLDGTLAFHVDAVADAPWSCLVDH